MQRPMTTLILILHLTAFILSANGQLKVEYSNATLPTYLAASTPLYDGDDSIYLFGGILSVHEISADVLKYSISRDTIEVVGHLPKPSAYGCFESYGNGHQFFYFGGDGPGNAMFKIDLDTNTSVAVDPFYTSISYCTSTKLSPNSSMAYIIGGNYHDNIITQFDMSEVRGPINIATILEIYPIASSVRIGNKLVLMGNHEGAVSVIDVNNWSTIVKKGVLPFLMGMPTTVYDSIGKQIYFMGGYQGTDGNPQALQQLHPDTLEVSEIPMENFPTQGDDFYYISPASVFVERLNRIYYFGGLQFTPGVIIRDDVWFIDLNNLKK